MISSPLTAISPVDGRYAEKTEALRTTFSEFGLIKYRTQVEIHWLRTLCAEAAIAECPELDGPSQKFLEQLVAQFGVADAERVKTIERTTNHDVKAVEYFIKEKFEEYPALAKSSEFVHFACTSEDINNLSYGLMLSDARKHHLLPEADKVIAKLSELAHDYAEVPMLSRTHGQTASPTVVGEAV